MFDNIKQLVMRILNIITGRKKVSETSKCRESLSVFCIGDGIDIGFGGDPIVPHAICMDLSNRYANYKDHIQHLHGDAKKLQWFQTESLDWVYSSHVLEDFENTCSVLEEWLRVIKPGGNLILFLPDEQTYRAHCKELGKPSNPHHIHDHFNLEHVKNCVTHRNDIETIHERFPIGIYSFELVLRKKRL